MSNKLFAEKEIKILSCNPYVQSVSAKGITYTDELSEFLLQKTIKGDFRGRYL